MSLPVLSTCIVKFYSQRIDGRPFVNCVPYSLCPILRWMVYDVPADYGMTLRVASGVPVKPGLGTSYNNMKVALAKELPKAPVIFSAVTDDFLIATLPRPGHRSKAKAVFSVYARMELLPSALRRHVGKSWEGWHAISIGGQQVVDGEQLVYWMDPMGKAWTGYSGEWVPFNSVKHTLNRTAGGFISCARGHKATGI